MKNLRLSIIGFGTVGQGLAELLATKRALLKQDYGLTVTLVSVANARHGFIETSNGFFRLEDVDDAKPVLPLPSHVNQQPVEREIGEGLEARLAARETPDHLLVLLLGQAGNLMHRHDQHGSPPARG